MEAAGPFDVKKVFSDNTSCEGFFRIVKSEMFYTRSWDGVSVRVCHRAILHPLVQCRTNQLSLGKKPIAYRSLGLLIVKSKKRPHPQWILLC